MTKVQLIEKAKKLGLNGIDEYASIKEIQKLVEIREEEIRIEKMTPYEYFSYVKSQVQDIDREDISKMYTAAQKLMTKYKKFGQKKAEKRLAFHIKTLLKEYKLVDLGITKYVYRDDIVKFIDEVSKKPVKIIEMSNYPREIPEEMIEIVDKTKSIFDDFFIVFTDYSEGELVKEVEKERDPILFGGFCTNSRDIVAERFYYLGDWVDEFCDLTLDKLIEQTSQDIVKEIEIPKNTSKLIAQLETYEEVKEDVWKRNRKVKEPFIKRVFNILRGK